jgi:Sulfotransferase domain
MAKTKADLGDDVSDGTARQAAAPKPVTTSLTVKVDGVDVAFDVATGLSGPAFFALGVRKSGSTLLHKIITFLAARNNVNAVDLPGTFFRKGLVVSHWQDVQVEHLIQPGNIYTGFRAFPPALGESKAFKAGLKVYMFRDPRDALVSQYFSDAYSHDIPTKEEAVGPGREIFLKKREAARQTDIEDYVMKHARALSNTLERYQPLLSDPNCLVLRYEDYVFQKRRLVHKVLKHFGWSLMPGQVDTLMEMVDQVPQSEDKMKFVRKAVPGDHREKLQPETIKRLNNQLRSVLDTYDYY